LEPGDRRGCCTFMVDIAMNTAEHWRQRAQETRADAERQTDPEIRKTMLEIAELYNQLAALAQKRMSSKSD
jgi:hypothetical protein